MHIYICTLSSKVEMHSLHTLTHTFICVSMYVCIEVCM